MRSNQPRNFGIRLSRKSFARRAASVAPTVALLRADDAALTVQVEAPDAAEPEDQDPEVSHDDDAYSVAAE